MNYVQIFYFFKKIDTLRAQVGRRGQLSSLGVPAAQCRWNEPVAKWLLARGEEWRMFVSRRNHPSGDDRITAGPTYAPSSRQLLCDQNGSLTPLRVAQSLNIHRRDRGRREQAGPTLCAYSGNWNTLFSAKLACKRILRFSCAPTGCPATLHCVFVHRRYIDCSSSYHCFRNRATIHI